MPSTILSIISGGVGAAIVGGVFSLIQWGLNRKASKNDKKCTQEDKILDQLAKLQSEIAVLDAKIDEGKAIDSRTRILRFGDEIQHGVKHSEEHFKQILMDIGDYERYCDTHPDFKNHITSHTTEKIIEVYKRCADENDFLM